jgi:S1-C subfamily serine protease
MAEVIREMSQGFAGIVEAAEGNVIRVEGRRRIPASGIVWSDDGVIVTAHHILKRDRDLNVGLPNGEMIPAELIGRDATTDLAALRVEGADLRAPKWGTLDDLRVGHLVLALGRPGKSIQATLGIVSAVAGSWRTSAGGEIGHYLQTDVVMYPGFSGGPLVNVEGEIVGLNTSAFRGVSLTLPTPTVSRVIESLLSHGRVRRGYLGVGLQPVRLPEKKVKGLDQETALLVISVEGESPAEDAGVVLGDTILALNDEPIRHLDDLLSKLGTDLAGVDASLRILRGGEVETLRVKVGEK